MYKAPTILSFFYPSLTWNVKSNNKVIYLTFDDGPIPEITDKVLDILSTFNAKATFFCIGENIEKHPKQFRRIIAEKHSVGNHTYNHLNGWKTSLEAYIDNTEKCSKMLAKEGIATKLFRPPYGRISYKQIKELSAVYQVIMWNTLSKDYNASISPETCLKNTLKHTKNGSIIVFHDSLKASKNMLYTLPKLLETLTQKGFKFEALPMC